MAGSTEIPQTVALADVPQFSDEVDVLVVGLGMAGGCAAVEAASHDAHVLVLERAAVAGGTTSLAGGHFYLGGGTAVQEATGHADSAEEMEKYLNAVSADPDPEKIHVYCRDSVEHFNWLEGLGFSFERSYYPKKAVIQREPDLSGYRFPGMDLLEEPESNFTAEIERIVRDQAVILESALQHYALRNAGAARCLVELQTYPDLGAGAVDHLHDLRVGDRRCRGARTKRRSQPGRRDFGQRHR